MKRKFKLNLIINSHSPWNIPLNMDGNDKNYLDLPFLQD